MCSVDNTLKNQMLDEIIAERRSYRAFTDEMISDEATLGIISAGLHAPYAGAAVSDDEYRKFFVIRRNSDTMKVIQPLLFNELKGMSENLEKAATRDPEISKQAAGFIKRLSMIKKMGTIPGVGTAPVFIVISEKKGFPPVEQASLAHCLENMWLKATVLGLGFQLVSLVSQMDNVDEFSQIFHLQPGEWAFMGCAIGYPAEKLPASIRPYARDVTTWLP